MIDRFGRDWTKTTLPDGRHQFTTTGGQIIAPAAQTDAQVLAVLDSMVPGVPDAVATRAAENAIFRDQARSFLLSDPSPAMKVIRALALVVLDEINIVRTNSAVLPGRTAPQLLDAVITKIVSGAAD